MEKSNTYTSDSDDDPTTKKPDLLQNYQDPIDEESVLISEAIQTDDLPFIKSLLQKTNIFDYNKEVHSCWLLHEAIDLQNTEIVTTLLQHGVCRELCPSVKSAIPPLHAAVAKGFVPVINQILRYNANWRKPNSRGETVIHLPFVSKEIHGYRGCASVSERAELKDKCEKTIIGVIELFLNRRMNINVKDKKGRTPLFLAAKYRMKSVVEYLLRCGADRSSDNMFMPNLVLDEIKSFRRENAIDDPALAQCIVKDNVEFLDFFLPYGFDVNGLNEKGKTPLQLALEYNMVHILPVLLKYSENVMFKDGQNKSILHLFIEANSRENSMTNDKLAHFAPINRHQNIENVVKTMIRIGLSVDATDESGTTPCLLVAKERRKELLKFMVERSCSPLVAKAVFPIVSGWIHSDDERKEISDEIISILVARGLILRQDNKWNMRFVLLSVKCNLQKTFNALVACGFDFKVLTERNENIIHLAIKEDISFERDAKTKEIFKSLVERGCDVNGRTKYTGRTPLHEAASSGNVEVIKILLQYEVNLDSRDYHSQQTPLHLAVKSKKNTDEIVQILIENGANVNAKDKGGETPLHLAIFYRLTNVLERLLSEGANVNAEDFKGRRLLDAALEHQNTAALDILLKYDVDLAVMDHDFIRTLSDLGQRDGIWNVLFSHLNLLHYLELPYPLFCQRYMSQEMGTHSAAEKLQEIEKLKNFVIVGTTTMYDFLHMSAADRIAYTKHEIFSNLMSWAEYEFPIYCKIIKAKYRAAI